MHPLAARNVDWICQRLRSISYAHALQRNDDDALWLYWYQLPEQQQLRLLSPDCSVHLKATYIMITICVRHILPVQVYQGKTKPITTPIYLRQICFECIGDGRYQIRRGKDFHTTTGALVATWCCVGRQAGLTGIQAVPMINV